MLQEELPCEIFLSPQVLDLPIISSIWTEKRPASSRQRKKDQHSPASKFNQPSTVKAFRQNCPLISDRSRFSMRPQASRHGLRMNWTLSHAAEASSISIALPL